jgi:hypothetical protein
MTIPYDGPMMTENFLARLSWRANLLAGLLAAIPCAASSQSPRNVYDSIAPLASYMQKDAADEIVLARSAAPPSVSSDADILVFSSSGYDRAATGKNGWTCLVQRSWNGQYDNPEFWNPKIRVPICFNAAASESVLPVYLERTKSVLARRNLRAVIDEGKLHTVPDPKPGSFAMMMSKQGYLGDGVGAAAPHVMIFAANVSDKELGANLDQAPVGATPGDKPSITIFYFAARRWSDGTAFVSK